MPQVNLKYVAKNGKKVSNSVSTAVIKPSSLIVKDGVATAGTLAVGDVVTLLTLPENVDVTNAYIYVKSAPTGGTQTFNIAVGGTDVVAAVALGTANGVYKGGTPARVNSGTSGDVTMTLGVAPLTDGEIRIVVEYVEYNKCTGELTA